MYGSNVAVSRPNANDMARNRAMHRAVCAENAVRFVTPAGEEYAVDEFGAVVGLSAWYAGGDLDVTRYECDGPDVLRVSRRLPPGLHGKLEFWPDGRWHAGLGTDLRPVGSAVTLPEAVALFAAIS